jgi:hypothetical protein
LVKHSAASVDDYLPLLLPLLLLLARRHPEGHHQLHLLLLTLRLRPHPLQLLQQLKGSYCCLQLQVPETHSAYQLHALLLLLLLLLLPLYPLLLLLLLLLTVALQQADHLLLQLRQQLLQHQGCSQTAQQASYSRRSGLSEMLPQRQHQHLQLHLLLLLGLGVPAAAVLLPVLLARYPSQPDSLQHRLSVQHQPLLLPLLLVTLLQG